MPRQPYSEAVPSSGGGGYNLSFLREERLGEKGGAFLKGKEGRVGFRPLRLFHHVPEEQAITDDISSPHKEVEDGTDGTYVTMDVQLIPMRVRPLLLLKRRHANPEQIRVGSIDGINDSLVVLIRELRLIRRRINWDSRIYFMNFA